MVDDEVEGGPQLREALHGIRTIFEQETPEIQPLTLEDWGRFEGELLVRMLDDGRLCELLADYCYYRPDRSHWLAPTGTKVDGASIPRKLWSLIGGPFEGKYRNASVIHDRYCDTHERPWRDTHRTFYEAMRCRGVDATQANIMYYAVYRFGPRWPEPGMTIAESVASDEARSLSEEDAATLLADARAIQNSDPSIEQIEALADRREGVNPDG